MAEPKLAFLTGATGFIGRRVARRLAGAGYRLRCLVRPSSETADLERLDAELVVGNATDAAALGRGLEAADVAYHIAGVYYVGALDKAHVRRANVDGTAAFLAAMERAGTPRGIYVSTTLALGPTPDGVGDESSEHAGATFRSEYQRTKIEAHRLARAAQDRGLPLIIACPAFAYGPGDAGPPGAFIRDLLAGRVPGLLTAESWWSYVHVDDVADGLARLAERGRTGETYVLGGDHRPLTDFASIVCRLGGRTMPRLRFPPVLARITAAGFELLAKATGRDFIMSRESVAMVDGVRYLHSHAKAASELGYAPRDLEAGLAETIPSYLPD